MITFFKKEKIKKIDDYNLKICKEKIAFPSRIYEIIEVHSKVLVVLSSFPDNIKEEFDKQRNIFCYDNEGNFLWQIQPTPYDNDSYLGALYNEELDKVYVFSHTRHDVDLETGKISNKTETR